MIQQIHRVRALAIGLCAMASSTASATFHLMQIEQVIGGVNGDVTEQAIQLRMRGAGQNQLLQARIRAWDATGSNPVIITNFETCPAGACVPNGAAAARVLITTANFNDDTVPATVSNFTMTNPIPSSYFAAGSLTFEADTGVVYWRLSWGGASYTGPGTMSNLNDPNSNANPPFAGPLPSTSLQALKFTGVASAMSNNNAADYALTTGAAVFNNNAGTSFTLQGAAVGACCLGDGSCAPLLSEADCTKFGGIFHGAGSDCGSTNCDPLSTGACCLTNGTCQNTDDGLCNKLAGTFQGFGTTCASGICEAPATGACCFENGDCLDAQTSVECEAATGMYQGDDSTCADSLCSKPCHGDINGDDTVNVDDLVELINQWGGTGSADINGDGIVNVDDLVELINEWGPCA